MWANVDLMSSLIQTRGYLYIWVCLNFCCQNAAFLDSVCDLACSKVFNLSKLLLIHIIYCICMMSSRFERQVKQKFHS